MALFLKLKKNLNVKKNLSLWKEKSQQNKDNEKKKNGITISFESPPPLEIKEQLKNLNLKWNAFRGEYYGFCEKNTLNFLNDFKCKIENIE